MDSYETIKQLAKGGQGVTSLVKLKVTTNFASAGMKLVLKATACQNIKAGNEALNEAKVLQKMRHTSVVQYHDVFLHSVNGYLVICTVMELCNRGDLANYLQDKKKRSSPLTEQVARSWMGQLADALAHLHRASIVHRDLKPHNVFLTAQGVLKVGDFGLSASLEQVMRHEAYGEAVDVWGAGCVAMEMLTLDFLWLRKGILAAQVKAKPVRADDLPARYSMPLRECVSECLLFEPAARPTAADLYKRVRASKMLGGTEAEAAGGQADSDAGAAARAAMEGWDDALQEVVVAVVAEVAEGAVVVVVRLGQNLLLQLL